MTVPDNFRDNEARGRFELEENGLIAFADYRRRGGCFVIPHVESPPALRGKGTADRLMRALAARARVEGFTIAPLCGYASAWFRRHPGEADVLAAER